MMRNKIMKNMKNGDLLHTLTNLDEELNNAVAGFKCGFWIGCAAGIVVSGVIIWAVWAIL